MRVRFIHTADWQLGARARFIPGDAGALIRTARLEVIRSIAALATEQKADFVVVAGDVFENHAVKPDTLRKAFDAMARTKVPFYLLPGNHDPYTPESIYRSRLWEKECPANVHLLFSTAPHPVMEGVVLLPCPLLDRTTLGDVTKHLSADFGPADVIRIGVAHGGIQEVLESLNDPEWQPSNVIPAQRAELGKLDYLALGDWHGVLKIGERTWYSGTPEATRFKEKEPGHVLVVEIDEKGAIPRVTPHRVGSKHWRKLSFNLSASEDLDALAEQLDRIEAPEDTLLELELEGAIEEPLAQRLDAEILTKAQDRLCFLRVERDKLHSRLRPEDLETLERSGWIGEVAKQLRSGVLGVPPEVTEDALRLLYRFHQEGTSG